jgi:hypothetical protein
MQDLIPRANALIGRIGRAGMKVVEVQEGGLYGLHVIHPKRLVFVSAKYRTKLEAYRDMVNVLEGKEFVDEL